jgi:hypothetical protein
VADPRKHDIEPSDSILDRKILDMISDYKLLNKDSNSLCQFMNKGIFSADL